MYVARHQKELDLVVNDTYRWPGCVVKLYPNSGMLLDNALG